MNWTQFQRSSHLWWVQGGYLATHACEGQKASQSTLKAYQDGSLHQGGLLDMLQLHFPFLHKHLACWITGLEADRKAWS